MENSHSRKQGHLEICLDEKAPINGDRSRMEELRFLHRSMPEQDWDAVDISRTFLGYKLPAPFLISPMTGGIEDGDRTNRVLAEAAGKMKLPFASGSMRILLTSPDQIAPYDLKELLPESPYLLNIGAQELKPPENQKVLLEISSRLKADGITVHLNPGQELFQSEGERNFRGIKKSLREFIQRSSLPVIVKETGCGIHPREVLDLIGDGATWVDLAGTGGSNWILVEGLREGDDGAPAFRDWGHPSLLALAALNDSSLPLIASGGFHDGMDGAKGLAMGAGLIGMARPLLLHSQNGTEAVISWLEKQILLLKRILLLTGSASLGEFNREKLWISPSLQAEIDQYKRSCFP